MMNSKTLSLIQKIIVIVIAVIAVFFYVKIMKNPEEAGGYIDNMLRFTYVVLALALLGTVLVWIKDIVTNPKNLMQMLVYLGLFALVVLIAKFVLASNEPVVYGSKLKIDAETSNWVDTGLYTFYILAVIAILLMLLSPVLSLVGGGHKAVEAVEEVFEDDDDETEEEE